MSTVHAVAAFDGLPISHPDALVDVEVPVPELRPRDLLVRVRAVSVNPVDVKVRSGLERRDTPKVLGWDAAGTVEAVGPQVEGFGVGDEVWYAGDLTRPGSNTELHAVDERVVSRKPTTLGFAEAAALPLTTITAWESLFDRLRLTGSSRGDLLVLGAAGGVGSVLVQLAKLRTGLRVLAGAGKAESREWVTALGADAVVDHHDLVASVRAQAPDGVDLLFSPHSTGNVEAFAEVLKPFGEVVAIDDPVGLDLYPLKTKSITWHWELMFTRPMFTTPDVAEQGRLLAETASLVDAGHLRSTLTTAIDDFSAAGLREAHRLVETGRTVGKVVVHR
ncbi:zinc-binding alcohol dehydrogenase family protein [Kineococcus indalonis]|uniref:zinc-binding alcohol dehydrogenase family protein n=1 Tax=Kineococcus indalonis TaxID=2696566 RepID=UPI001411DD6A|nr:zinc-binding alcohol dehydrogenase family protein [Kineococcus indalonis]NAZ87214.1 zinc-binding alcohol dehydrogenase family protein [Kineococcus indalonis]